MGNTISALILKKEMKRKQEQEEEEKEEQEELKRFISYLLPFVIWE